MFPGDEHQSLSPGLYRSEEMTLGSGLQVAGRVRSPALDLTICHNASLGQGFDLPLSFNFPYSCVRHTSAAGIPSIHRWYSLDYGVTIKTELPRKIRPLDRP